MVRYIDVDRGKQDVDTPNQRRMLLLLVPVILFLAWPKFLLSAEALYITDYAVRVVVIGMFLAFGGLTLPSPEPQASTRWRRWGVVAAVGVGVAVLVPVDQYLWNTDLDAPWIIPQFPAHPSAMWRVFDLTLGLALVAVSEELAFRRIFFGLWRQVGWPALTLISSVAFALLHAPQGVVPVILAGVIGALLMVAYRMSGTVWVPIALHYVFNLVCYSGVMVDFM